MTPRSPHGLLRWLQWQPQRAVGALALVLAVLLCALVADDLQRDYAQQLSAASARTGSLTQLLEEHARQSMRRVELALSLAAQDVVSRYQTSGAVTAATGARLRAYLPQDGLIASFTVFDSHGKALASTLTEVADELPVVADRDYFLAMQQPTQSGLLIGRAIRSRISGLWTIPVGVKLEGGLGGYLMGAVDPEYFQHLYQSIDTGEDGFVTLFTAQGWAVARWPFNSEIAEQNWLDSPLLRDDVAAVTVTAVPGKVAATGVDSVYSRRVLQDYPLVAALGVSRDELLQPWREHAWFECGALLLVLLFLGSVTGLLMAQLRRRLQAESALRLSEISVLKSSLPTLWVGADARVLRVNQAACELHGYTEEQMLGMTVPDLNPAMSMQSWPAHWQRLRQTRTLHFETTHRTGQGQDVPVEVDLNYIEFEGQEFNFAFIRDLRVRKQAASEIQRSAALLRSAIDAVDEAFVLFDTDDRLVYCNAKYAQLYPAMQDVVVPGARFEDMIRIGAQRGLYRESIGHEEEWIKQRLQAHREGNESRIQRRDDGRVLRVIDRRTPEGNIAGIRVDITDMVKATEEAQAASRYKSQFLANMSHEIRTPMNAILGLLALLQNTELSAAQRDYASKTEGAAQSLLHLLNDILDFSKVEAGKMELDPQPLRLDHMLRDIAVILSSTMAGKAIELLFDIDARVPAVVVADAQRLKQVLVNLGGNAIKFTQQGQVVIRVRCAPDADDSNHHQARLEFSIQDSGIGIAPEQHEHIFTGFSQAEASTTRRFGGSGLGLAISRRLVALMGGQLVLQSALGQGSTFSFALPLPLPETGTLAPRQTPRWSASPLRVLVVDDNPVARDILAAMVRSWSWSIELAASGAQALERMRALHTADGVPLDLIYLDWQMPGMDGWETARQMRQLCQGQARQPRILMLSAHSHDSPLQRSAQERTLIDGFLFKPVTASVLFETALDLGPDGLQTQRAQRSSQRPLAGLRILVVEDNLVNQQVAQELLSAEGAQVSLAANGQLGVDAVAGAQPGFDVVLMDIQMPVLDGFGATRKIRGELGLGSLPIVAMTANAMASDRLACLAAGMNDHVGKPFDTTHLVSVLLAVSGRRVVLPDVAGVQPSPAQPPVPLFKNSYLDVAPALERISGLASLYVDIAQEFIRSLDAVDTDFRRAALAGQLTTLVAQMHTLKGTSATLGADALSRYAAALETQFRQADAQHQALEHLPALQELVQHTRAATVQAVTSLQHVADADAMDARHANAAAPRPLAGPLAHARARAFLGQLAALLAASNLGALEHFAQRGELLTVLPERPLQELQEALRSLQLERARQLCERCLAALGQEPLQED